MPQFNAIEAAGVVTISVTRNGDSSTPASVDYATSDDSATQQGDYTIAAGTLVFAAGETNKTLTVLIVDDAYQEGTETFRVLLSNPTGASLGARATATTTVFDDDFGSPATNPIEDARRFVHQHYYDFLSRMPDQAGIDYWSTLISACGSDQVCIRSRRIMVSDAFFFEPEYQQTASYVFRLYRAAYGDAQPFPNPDTANLVEARKLPSYAAFMMDRARIVAGPGLAQSQLDLARALVQRPEFVTRYPATLSGSAFVDALLTTIRDDIGCDLTAERNGLIDLFNIGGRAAVLYRIADDNAQTNPINNRAFIDAEYNRAFVATQYFGYLRRDSDIGGFLFWLGQVNGASLRDVNKQHSMVCAFITSAEYQLRFSGVVTHSNSECTH